MSWRNSGVFIIIWSRFTPFSSVSIANFEIEIFAGFCHNNFGIADSNGLQMKVKIQMILFPALRHAFLYKCVFNICY